jgi:hypothetical protein
MLAHHSAWLAAHPGRTAEWLAGRLRDGFEIHHLNENRDDNDPSNLVMIEGVDHMRLHGMQRRLAQSSSAGRKGGAARMVKMTREQRVKVAQKAGRARWRSTAKERAKKRRQKGTNGRVFWRRRWERKRAEDNALLQASVPIV